MTLYLTSTNNDKLEASKFLLNKFNITNIECIESKSGIEGGQPYGLYETKKGCINRTLNFNNNENFISIENGFIRYDNTNWYDIAFIYIRINNMYYSGWTEKRWFPKEYYNDTNKLIKHFEKKSITRFKQLHDCICKIISSIKT